MSSVLHALLESIASHCNHHCFVDVIAVINECMILFQSKLFTFFCIGSTQPTKKPFLIIINPQVLLSNCVLSPVLLDHLRKTDVLLHLDF